MVSRRIPVAIDKARTKEAAMPASTAAKIAREQLFMDKLYHVSLCVSRRNPYG